MEDYDSFTTLKNDKKKDKIVLCWLYDRLYWI